MATNLTISSRLDLDLAHSKHGARKWRREGGGRQDVEHGGEFGGPAFEQNLIRLQDAFTVEQIGVVHIVEELGRRGVQIERRRRAPAHFRAQRLQLRSQVRVQAGICRGVQPCNDGGAVDPAYCVCTRERDHVALGEPFASEALRQLLHVQARTG